MFTAVHGSHAAIWQIYESRSLWKPFVVMLLLAKALLGQTVPVAPPSSLDLTPQLLNVTRLYVDKFSGGETSSQLRDMVIASLQKTKLFVLTENPDRADAVLRGSAEDLVYTDTFQTSEGVQARVGMGSGEGGTSSRDREYRSAQASFGDNESTRIAERKHEASATVRIVNREGDIIWSTTQESQGAKFQSASKDVAERIAKQLVTDYTKAKVSGPVPATQLRPAPGSLPTAAPPKRP